MTRSQHPAITYSNLIGIRKLLEQSDKWRPDPVYGYDNRLVTAIDIFIGYLADDIATGVDKRVVKPQILATLQVTTVLV